MKNSIRFLFVLMFVSRVFSVGEAGAVFLLINPGSSAAGAGEAQVAKANDAYASYYNPAGLGFLRGKEVVLQHVNWLPNLADDIFYEFLAYRQSVEGLGTFGGHLIYLNLGEQQGMDAQGTPTTLFKSYMMAFNLSYGTQISQKQSVGMNFKVFHQKLADEAAEGETGDPFSTDFAFDIGYLKKFGKNLQHQVGFSIQNIGPEIDFIDSKQADPAPTNMKFGIYAELFNDGVNKINLLFDANKLLVASYPTMDWNGDGIISGSKEQSHTDPWYKGVFTAWLDDWKYGGDRDLCEGACLEEADLDLDLHGYRGSADNRIGGYYEKIWTYIDNDDIYTLLNEIDKPEGQFSSYYFYDYNDQTEIETSILYNDEEHTSIFADNNEHLNSLDWLISNYNETEILSFLDVNLNQSISKIEGGIVYVPNYAGFCDDIYTSYGGSVYATGETIDNWHGYSMCYDEEGDSYYSYTDNNLDNDHYLGTFNDPQFILSKSEDFGNLKYIDLPHDGIGDFDVFDEGCDAYQLNICNGDEADTPINGQPHFDIDVSSDMNSGEFAFNEAGYGVLNAHGNYEKGTGKQRKFKDELEEMIYNFGIEWEYTESFVMRLGFIYDLEGDIKNPTFGAGINFSNYGFDFGYTAGDKGHPRENTMFFSLSLGL